MPQYVDDRGRCDGGVISLKRATRWACLALGSFACGCGVSGQIAAGLGASPWDAFHVALAAHLGLRLGNAIIVVSVMVLGLSAFLRAPIGPATLLCPLITGLTVDLLPPSYFSAALRSSAGVQWAGLFVSVATLALGTAIYLSAQFGAGPRDALMLAAMARGLPVWAARGVVEGLVVTAAAVLGGPIGAGTLFFAASVGPMVNLALRHQRMLTRQIAAHPR